MADIEHAQQMIPLITCEISFGKSVGKLVFGVDVFDLDFGVQIDSIEKPIKSNSVGPRTPSFDNLLDHCSPTTYNKTSGCENWTFEGTQSILSKTLIIP